MKKRRGPLKSRTEYLVFFRDFRTTIRPFLVFCERFWESREASENNYAFLASYSLKIKARSKNSFSANLCVLCASAVAIFSFLTAEAQSTQRFAEKKRNQRVNRNTSAQRFGCGLGHAMISVDTLFLFGFGSDSNIRAAVSSSEEELHNTAYPGYPENGAGAGGTGAGAGSVSPVDSECCPPGPLGISFLFAASARARHHLADRSNPR